MQSLPFTASIQDLAQPARSRCNALYYPEIPHGGGGGKSLIISALQGLFRASSTRKFPECRTDGFSDCPVRLSDFQTVILPDSRKVLLSFYPDIRERDAIQPVSNPIRSSRHCEGDASRAIRQKSNENHSTSRRRFTVFRKSLTEYPKLLTEYRKSLTEYPKLLTEYPKSLTEYPKTLTEYPKLLTEYPKLLTEYLKLLTEL
jgi:hypothetical protein